MVTGNDFKFNKKDLNFLIKLKARELKRKDIHNITEQQIKDYLFEYKWKQQDSMAMCEIIDDIMNLNFSELFDYLSLQVVKEASHLSINDFSDFISK
ncbi:post-transcriptional regulator [Thomasclavelia sp.]|uniref:post-transcriptional regulator n=1 Tax=Thomasclavelia sp. TaxID=3025757 RepID=UPI0025F411D4|nr:post-transcriptional regulator [Thomasclavelia sp.]